MDLLTFTNDPLALFLINYDISGLTFKENDKTRLKFSLEQNEINFELDGAQLIFPGLFSSNSTGVLRALQKTLQKFDNDTNFDLSQVSGLELHGLELISDKGERLFSLEGNVSNENDLNIDYLNGTASDDELLGTSDIDYVYAGYGDDWIETFEGNDVILGGEGDDIIYAGFGENVISGADGNDTIYPFNYVADALVLNNEADKVDAGRGNDTITLTSNTTHDSKFAHNVGSTTQVATNTQISLVGKVKLETVVDGGADADTINLGSGNDAFFLHDSFSGFHSSLTLTTDTHTGAQGTQRILNVETINGLDGDDIIDLTSPDYSLAGQVITINGGAGR